MVQLTSTLLLALAASASAHRRFERRGAHDAHHQLHARHDAPMGTGAAAAPYPAGNATDAGAATGTVTSLTTYSTTTVAVTSYVTVQPLPEASGAAAGAGSEGGAPAAEAGGEQCGPATVTVTAPANTVTVTVPAEVAPVTTTSAAAAAGAPAPDTYKAEKPAAEKKPAEEKPAEAQPAAEKAAAEKPAEKQVEKKPAEQAAAEPAKKVAAPAPHPPKVPVSPKAGTTSVGGGKRGVGYDSAALLSGFANSGVTWGHNWHMSTDKMGLQFVPTLKDKSQLGDFEAKCEQAIASGSKALFTFNEPDMVEGGGGSNMSPEEAAQIYKDHVNKFAGKIALGAPSVTSHNASSGATGGPSGMVWLQRFADACAGACHVDFVNLHFYGGETETGSQTAQIFKDYVTAAKAQVAGMFGKELPVWMTEFSAIPTADKGGAAKNAEFLGGVMDFLDANCEKYAFFMASANNLVDGSGGLTSLGQKYAA